MSAISTGSLHLFLPVHHAFCSACRACAGILFILAFWASTTLAQSANGDLPISAPVPLELWSAFSLDCDSSGQNQSTQAKTLADANSAAASAPPKQSKRILWIFPNYRAVSADTQLPPLSLRSKFWLATQDSFDYSSFVTAGIIAGFSQAKNSTPEFRQGAKGYGRYYWHAVADQAVGNYLTEAIVPALTHEDPRYYTLGHGKFLKRAGYAVSRLVVTRTDSGGRTFDFSEIVGNGAGAGISNFYYPGRERTWTKTGQKWLTQIGLDGAFNVLKEFWPDINHFVFRGKY